jgi:hypothetical protein
MGLKSKAEKYKDANAAGGIKFDRDKPRWDLVPWDELEDVVRVLTMGAVKYNDNNWMKIEPIRYKSAAMRHIKAAFVGETKDADSGLSHYAHALCCLLFLAWHERHPEAMEKSNG